MSKKCATKHCRNKVTGRMFCASCRSRQSRESDPIRYAYNTKKYNAKKKRKPFQLTFEQFKKFCHETNYIKKKGITKKSYSIDCIINELGYVEGNIEIKTVSANSKKGTKVLVYDWQTRQAKYITVGERNKMENDHF